jgi:hypothetical protein
MQITVDARKRKIGRIICSVMLPGDDMLDMKGKQPLIILMNMAVLATI